MRRKAERAIAELNATIRDLQRELDKARDRHHDDITAIGEKLIEEAQRRHCGPLYDDLATGLNHGLSVKLPQRPRAFTVYVPCMLQITVDAVDPADARDEAYPHVLFAERELNALPRTIARPDHDSVQYEVTQR